ncbi:MAG: hypothetical protein EOP51_00045 [Sphingobacteriales bacterium]|nr:MAG: hypothetical protein EOP51_00045 [Sphingobacteriales bacterium]
MRYLFSALIIVLCCASCVKPGCRQCVSETIHNQIELSTGYNRQSNSTSHSDVFCHQTDAEIKAREAAGYHTSFKDVNGIRYQDIDTLYCLP